MKTDAAYLARVSGNLSTRVGSPTPERKNLSAVIGAVAVAIGLLAACSAPGQPNATPSTTTSSTASQPSSRRPELAADFQITLYQGQDVLGGQDVEFSGLLEHEKPVILNFWAGRCPPCRVEMPDFQEMHAEYGEEVILVGVDVGAFTGLGTGEDALALLEEVGATYPAGTTPDPKVVRDYQVIGMPTTIFIKPNGEIFEKWTGLLTRDKLVELTQALIEASKN
ncbi:MAG: TlpA disulfide reductase family protein [Anaerolineae bacterium]|jgi:thiol-disulfide isomerase/thioredoxin